MSNLSISATEAASRYLGHRGYTVLETGWTCPAGTADIVAKDGDTIVFVDVSFATAQNADSRRIHAPRRPAPSARTSPLRGSPSTKTP